MSPPSRLTEADQSEVKKKVDIIRDRIPDCLFKFRSLSNDHDIEVLKKAILDQELFWQSPSNFNDPFDCSPCIEFDGTESEKKDFLECTFLRVSPGLTKEKVDLVVAEFLKQPDDVIAEKLFAQQQNMRTEIAVSCFTANPYHPLMWAHYAGSHTGVCLRIKLDLLNQALVPFPVVYSEHRAIINMVRRRASDLLEQTILTKAEFWDYEDEWRVIDQKSGPGYRSLGTSKINGVIIGALMEPDKRKDIFETIGRSTHPIEILQAKLDRRDFKMVIERI